MRRIYLLMLLLATFSGCKKDSSGTDYTVIYKFSSNQSGSYQITWTNDGGGVGGEAFTGTTFTKTVVFHNPGKDTHALFTGTKNDINAAYTGTMSITVNNQVVNNSQVQFGPDTSNGWNFYAVLNQ